MRLFEAIATGEASDDEQVREKFKSENFINHLHKTKGYLYEALLETLLNPLQSNYIRLQILKKLEFAEVLVSRKMMDQAEEQLLEAYDMAVENGEVELELLLCTELSSLQFHLHNSQTYIDKLYSAHLKMEEYLAHNKFYVRLIDAYSKRGKPGAVSAEQLVTDPLFTSAAEPESIKARRIKEVCRSLIYTVQKEYDLALKSNYKILSLTEGLERLSPLREIGFINAVFNICHARQGQKLAFDKEMKMLEDFKPYSLWGKSHHFICLSRVKLLEKLGKEKVADSTQLVEWTINGIKENESILNEVDLVKIWFPLASLLLKEKKYDQALDFLYKINNSKEAKEKRTIIYRGTQLYQLIAYYEMGDLDRLSGMLRNYKYYQKKDDSFYLIEKEVAGFLTEAMSIADKKEKQLLKAEFTRHLYENHATHLRSGLAYLENISWIKNSAP